MIVLPSSKTQSYSIYFFGQKSHIILFTYKFSILKSMDDGQLSALSNGSNTTQVCGFQRSEDSHCRDRNWSLLSKSKCFLVFHLRRSSWYVNLFLMDHNITGFLLLSPKPCRLQSGSVYTWLPRDMVLMETPNDCIGPSWVPRNCP